MTSNHVVVVMEEPRQEERDDEQSDQHGAERLVPAEAAARLGQAPAVHGRRRVMPLPHELLAATAAGDVHRVLTTNLATPAAVTLWQT